MLPKDVYVIRLITSQRLILEVYACEADLAFNESYDVLEKGCLQVLLTLRMVQVFGGKNKLR